MKVLKFKEKDFFSKLYFYTSKREKLINKDIDFLVGNIINDVKKNGDSALVKYTKKLDNINFSNKNIKLINHSRYYSNKLIDRRVITSFKKAIKNITDFHKKQLPKNYEVRKNQVRLISQWQPMESVGLYIPGGRASYPSSLLMTAIPAIVAGVKRIVCVTPPVKKINPYIVKLLEELKIHEVYFVGGAQAIAALAYGTKTIKPVNKIFGPGNAYVTSAKKQVFGKVGIDLIAGPSEIVVVANEKNNPKWVASDLMAQAEHDENAQSILITNSKKFSNAVQKEIIKISKNIKKTNILTKSLNRNGLVVLIENFNYAADIINYIGPEHLHIHLKNYKKILSNIRNAGAIFIGEFTTEAFGDYIVGTNHVLPTFGSSKFSSGLGVIDFMKRKSIIEMNKISFDNYANDVKKMAEVEGLEAHKLSVKIRQTNKN